MSEALTGEDLATLIESVFAVRPDDRGLAILVDLPDLPDQERQESSKTPDGTLRDHQAWADRRSMAADWRDRLLPFEDRLGMKVRLFQYPNAGANNADLPSVAWAVAQGDRPAETSSGLNPSASIPMATVFEDYDVILALTELSATAPLKVAARRWGFRAATMPGFSAAMLPALRLDYEEVHRRCKVLEALLDGAQGARFTFRVDDQTYSLFLDLRHRRATASGGLVREAGQAGNLPSGETYIVPYEGEIEGDPTRSAGEFPVEFASESESAVLIYTVTENRAVAVRGHDAAATDRAAEEAGYLAREPAYGNLAELGLGVLGDWGIQPIGSVLLDEKLGLHIAFGRSEHFGGQVGPDDFSSPRAVVHIDRVYLPATQPRVSVKRVDLEFTDAPTQPLMIDGRYVVDLSVDLPVGPDPEADAS